MFVGESDLDPARDDKRLGEAHRKRDEGGGGRCTRAALHAARHRLPAQSAAESKPLVIYVGFREYTGLVGCVGVRTTCGPRAVFSPIGIKLSSAIVLHLHYL